MPGVMALYVICNQGPTNPSSNTLPEHSGDGGVILAELTPPLEVEPEYGWHKFE